MKKNIVISLIFLSFCSCAAGCKSKVILYYDSTKRIRYNSDDPVFLVGATNNNVEKYGKDVDFLISAKPDERQLNHYDVGGYYNFIHFGINTYTDREWGTGNEDISIFNPKKLDTDAWCSILKESGSGGVILTAKHHDGFCLFPSEYTDNDISNTPYKNGQGDIVKDLSLSCQKYGMKMGIYLSPWDMHEKTYGTNAYNTFFKNQLKEILNKDKYGEIFEVWFDGARGSDATLDEDFSYDFNRNFSLILNNKATKFSIRELDYEENVFGNYVANSGEAITLKSDGVCSFAGGVFGSEEIESSYSYDITSNTLTFNNFPLTNSQLTTSFEECYFGIIRELQPKAVISVIGPDIRWIGNEDGIINDTEWSVRGKGALTKEEIEEHSQHNNNDLLTPSKEVVSRKLLLNSRELIWSPSESDVKNRPSWFYHKKESPISASSLVSLYYRNVGGNGNFLLNVPPNKEGLFDDKDVRILKKFGDRIKNEFSKSVSYTGKIGNTLALVNSDELNEKIKNSSIGSGYHFKDNDCIVDLDFKKLTRVKNIVLSEDITCGQRIEDFSIYFKKQNGSFVLVSHHETIGAKRVIALDPKLNNNATGIRLVINQSRNNPVLNYFGVFE